MRKIWIDYLRILGIIAVIISHSSSSYYENFGNIQMNVWWYANILNSFSRFAVPLFIMISGCVLLGRDLGIKKFYTKRAVRLIPPLLFWSIFFLMFRYVLADGNISLLGMIKGFIISGKAYFHLWYLSMFICLMVFVPFINKYILGEKPTIEDFIFLFFAFAIFMTLNQISSLGIQIFEVNMYWFKDFHWFLGYFILGYFVDVYQDKIPVGNALGLLIFVLLSILGCILNYYFASQLDIIKDYLILDHTGIINFIRTILIFYLFVKNKKIFKQNNLVSSISKMTFGIYLIHPFFLKLVKTNINFLSDYNILSLSLVIITVFILSYFTTLMLKKMRWIKNFC